MNPVLLATYELGDALLTALAIFFFVIWIWVVIAILMDIFRDHDMSGWGKAIWVFFLIVFPPLTALVYLIARGSGMRKRALKDQAESQKQFEQYVRDTAGSSSVDELHKLDQLKQSGGVTDEEYNKLKAEILS
ncbi:MAG: SHOCT domain-containing protein [Solirubrobacterales bacterium]|nr:SHOCT domain-containing protein [Solirubrobacterales bacterium]